MNFDTNFVKCSKCAQEYNSRDRDHHDKVCRPGRTHRTAFPSSEPLAEGRLSPDASSECAVYGRSSTRKRNGGHPGVQIYHSSKGSHNVNSQDQLPNHLLQPPGAPLIGVGPQFNGFKHKYYDSPSQDRLDEHFVNYQDWSPDLQSWGECASEQQPVTQAQAVGFRLSQSSDGNLFRAYEPERTQQQLRQPIRVDAQTTTCRPYRARGSGDAEGSRCRHPFNSVRPQAPGALIEASNRRTPAMAWRGSRDTHSSSRNIGRVGAGTASFVLQPTQPIEQARLWKAPSPHNSTRRRDRS